MTVTNFKRKTFFMPVLLVAGVALLSGSSAFAGFEWKGAASAPAAQAPVQQDAAPSGMSAQSIVPVESAPVSLTASPLPAPPAVSSDEGEVVTGFGADIPLLVAMQQVVPEGYNVSLGDNVNPDQTVSWRGGKGWKAVLQDMVAPVGLGFHVENRDVTVGNFSGDGKTVASSAALAPVMKQSLSSGAPNKADMIPLDMIAAAKTPQEISVQPVPVPVPVKSEQVAAPAVDQAPVNLASLPPALAVTSAPATPAVAAPVSAIAAVDGLNIAGPNPQLMGPTWLAMRGNTLKEVLTDWTKRRGIELYWSIDYDYRLNDSKTYNGNFEDAVSQLLERFEDTRPQPFGELHLGKNGPNVLVVSSYDLPR